LQAKTTGRRSERRLAPNGNALSKRTREESVTIDQKSEEEQDLNNERKTDVQDWEADGAQER
jgi:hypothetical protein